MEERGGEREEVRSEIDGVAWRIPPGAAEPSEFLPVSYNFQ